MRRHMRIAGWAWLSGLATFASAGASQTQIVHRFQYSVDGYGPQSVIKGPDGDLYGVLLSGPDQTRGAAIFQLRPPKSGQGAWTSNVLYQFPGAAGGGTRNWLAPTLLADSAGNLYGTIEQSKQFEYPPETGGYIFELKRPAAEQDAWTLKTLLPQSAFSTIRSIPRLSYVDSGGVLYGHTDCFYGNASDAIVRMAPPTAAVNRWTASVLKAFTNNADGYCPIGFVPAVDGSFYGSNQAGGPGGHGAVYRLTPPVNPGSSWTYKVVTAFIGYSDFDFPFNTPAVDRSLTLFVSTQSGGNDVTNTGGTVLQATPPASGQSEWNYKLIYSLPATDFLNQPMVEDRDGKLYNVTDSAQAGRCGVVFRVTPSSDPDQLWHGTDVHVFTGSPDGAITVGPLVRTTTAAGGTMFFGVTQRGGNTHVAPQAQDYCGTGDGTVYAVTP